MQPHVSASQMRATNELNSLEQLAANRTRSKLNLQAIQFALGGIEYLTYLITFAILFVMRVLPDYPEISTTSVTQWFNQIPIISDYCIYLLLFLGLYLLLTYQKQFYSIRQERSLTDEFIIIVKLISLSFLIAIGITFLMKNTMVYSRAVLLFFFSTTIFQAMAYRYIRKWTFYQLKKYGKLKQNVLIVGAGRVGMQFQKLFMKSETHGYHFVGFLDDQKLNERVMGTVDDLEKVVREQHVDILYITIPSERKKLDPLIQRIYKYQIDIRIIPELYDRMTSVYEYRQDYDYPCLQIVKTPLRGLNLVIKRCMDIIISLLGIMILSPLWALVAVAIKLSSSGPVFYNQKRLGKNGVPFVIYKFRSMVTDADQKLEVLNDHNDMTGPAFKMKDDPRVTKVGAFIRKYSIDEFPQLLNVIKGEMSLIGPRPPLPDEVKQYSDHQWRRMDVRPGMTGLWQVSGRSDLTFDEWINLDIQYIERWSIALEFKILLKTIPVVVKGSGAY
ncbi:sugar transferase [Cohnella suwonensis]|uniref:Sugar transferase n=1 Tax=Cohnella suwonensis TaxID=696072 RepID=A0ABW0LV53_9BACL